MKRKRLSKSEQKLTRILGYSDDEGDQLTTTSQENLPSISSSSDNSNINSSTLNTNNSNETNSDVNMSIQTPSLNQDFGGQKLVSKVWLYATKSDDGEQAACQLCDFKCSCHSHSTSTIRAHLISKHNKADLIIPPSTISKIVIPEPLKKELHQLCYNAIIKDSRSFNDLNKSGIKVLLNKLCPGYSPPHRNQVSQQLKVIYNQQYYRLKEELKQVYRLGITLDFWSNRQSESFLCITGHWINDSWDLVSKIIDFSAFNSRHTAIEIAGVLKEKLIALGIYEKIMCITCDGAKNMVLACQYLNDDIPRIWCYAHRMHLVVVNAFGFWLPDKKKDDNLINSLLINMTTNNITTNNITTFDNNINNDNNDIDVDWNHDLNEDSGLIPEPNFDNETDEATPTVDENNNNTANEAEDINVYISRITADDDEATDNQGLAQSIQDNWSINFEENVNPTEQQKLIMNVLTKCRSIAKVVKRSTIISEFIRTEQQLSKYKLTIRHDCKTRWNSTFVLTHSLIQLKHYVIKLFSEKRSFKLRKDQMDKLMSIELDYENWELLSSLNYVLKPFFFATTVISGKNYPSIGLCYYAIYRIKYFCANNDNSNEQIKNFKKLLLDKLNKYFFNDYEQLQYLQRHAYFDPAAHLCLADREKQQVESYIKKLIIDDVYPIDLPTNDNSTQLSSSITSASASTSTSARPKHQVSINTRSQLSAFEQFLLACGEEQEEVMAVGNSKEKSKRVCISEELKLFKILVQTFNLSVKPSPSSAIQFWKMYKDRLPLLSHLAKIHLIACATSVPSESAFSSSAFIARKERARLSGQNLSYSVFLKDKV